MLNLKKRNCQLLECIFATQKLSKQCPYYIIYIHLSTNRVAFCNSQTQSFQTRLKKKKKEKKDAPSPISKFFQGPRPWGSPPLLKINQGADSIKSHVVLAAHFLARRARCLKWNNAKIWAYSCCCCRRWWCWCRWPGNKKKSQKKWQQGTVWTTSRWWKVRLRDTLNVRVAVWLVHVCDFGSFERRGGEKKQSFYTRGIKGKWNKMKRNSHEEYFSFLLATHTFPGRLCCLTIRQHQVAAAPLHGLELQEQRVPLEIGEIQKIAILCAIQRSRRKTHLLFGLSFCSSTMLRFIISNPMSRWMAS